MKKRNFKSAEWTIIICVILLIAISLIALYTATKNSELDEFKKQCIWIVISSIVLVIFSKIDYNWLSEISPFIYGIFLILLIIVLFTTAVNGATSWFNIGFFAFQPGELAKVFVIIFLSTAVVQIQKKSEKEINKISKVAIILAIGLVPTILIALQPDYGTAIAYMVAMVLILYVAGIDKKYIIISFAILLISIPLLYFFVLPEHAKARIDVYLNPNLDPRGAGYNIIQSKLAIGAGRLFGMGFLNGTQTQLGFLYPKSTDFIFAVIGEEFGFVMCAIIVGIYVVLITKSIQIAKTAKDTLGSYIAIGIVGIFLFHFVENIGMTIGLLPITGIPLPFISYGGSSLLTNFIAIGLLLNISSKSKKSIFS